MRVKKTHFTTPSLSWAELARLLLVICWGPLRAPPGGYQWHPRPGVACALSRTPPPGPTACWPTLRTWPSVLPPIGKLANEATRAALPWFGRLARGVEEEEEGGCGEVRDAPWCFREPLHNTFLMSAPPEGCWNVSEPSGEKWSVAESSWTLTAAI